VGLEDATALLAGLDQPAQPLASLGLVAGLAKVARGELSRDQFLAQNGHRGAQEFELSAPRLAEDRTWIDRQLAEMAHASLGVDALLANRRQAYHAAALRLSNVPRERSPAAAKDRRERPAGPSARGDPFRAGACHCSAARLGFAGWRDDPVG